MKIIFLSQGMFKCEMRTSVPQAALLYVRTDVHVESLDHDPLCEEPHKPWPDTGPGPQSKPELTKISDDTCTLVQLNTLTDTKIVTSIF